MIESLAAQASVSLQSGDLIETIRQERRRFESVFRTVPFGLCVADNAEGTLVRFNPAGASMFGVTPSEHLTPGTLASQRVIRAVLSPMSRPNTKSCRCSRLCAERKATGESTS